MLIIYLEVELVKTLQDSHPLDDSTFNLASTHQLKVGEQTRRAVARALDASHETPPRNFSDSSSPSTTLHSRHLKSQVV